MNIFTRTEKYKALEQEKADLQAKYDSMVANHSEEVKALEEALKQNEQLEEDLNNLRNSDLAAENQALKSQLAKVEENHEKELATIQKQVSTLQADKTTLTESLQSRDKRIAEMQTTIDRLNGQVPTPSAPAVSETDDAPENDINQFCAKNSDNKDLLFERFAKEGL